MAYITNDVSQSINQSINHAAGDAPCQFKETNHMRRHCLWLGGEWKFVEIHLEATFILLSMYA